MAPHLTSCSLSVELSCDQVHPVPFKGVLQRTDLRGTTADRLWGCACQTHGRAAARNGTRPRAPLTPVSGIGAPSNCINMEIKVQ